MKKLKNIMVKASLIADFYAAVFGALAYYIGFKIGLLVFTAAVLYLIVFLYANSTLWEAKYEQRRKKRSGKSKKSYS